MMPLRFLLPFLFLPLKVSAQHLRYTGATCDGFYRFLQSHKHCGITDSYLIYNLTANIRRRWFNGWKPCWNNCWEADATVTVRLREESSIVLWTQGEKRCPRFYRRYLARVRAHEALHRKADHAVFDNMDKVLTFTINGADTEEAVREQVQDRLDQEKKIFGKNFNNRGRPLHRNIDRERCNDFFNCAQCK
jgi:hypothetical protein